MVVLLCPNVAWQFQIPRLLSSTETRVYTGIRSWKKVLIWMSSMSKSHWWYLFHKEVKSRDSKCSFRIWQLQTPAKERYLHTHLLDNGSFVGCHDLDFLEDGIKTFFNGTNVVSYLLNFFPVLTSIVFDQMRNRKPWNSTARCSIVHYNRQHSFKFASRRHSPEDKQYWRSSKILEEKKDPRHYSRIFQVRSSEDLRYIRRGSLIKNYFLPSQQRTGQQRTLPNNLA